MRPALNHGARSSSWSESSRARSSTSGAAVGFFSEFLQQDGLSSLAKDSLAFPAFTAATASSMREESQLFLQDILFDHDSDLRGVFDADYTFVDARLAPLYELTQPAGGYVRMQLPASQPRAGLLTQTAFLALMSHPASTSPTYRGKFVRERLLCETVSAPPPNVNTNLPPNDPGTPRTLRQKLASHLTNASCSGCHAAMDPIGFGFESFDAMGHYRTQEFGLPIDSTGSFDGKPFANAKELGFSLSEINELLSLRVGNGISCVEVKERAQQKLANIHAKIQSLNRMKRGLERLASACRGRGPTSECPILEALDGEEVQHA